MRHRYLGVLAINLWACGLMVSAATAAGTHFVHAKNSVVPYTDTPHRSVEPCAKLSKMAEGGVTVRATLVAATADVPEHCEIIATVPPETGVYVGLPIAWNGRLWMIGNGGFGGGGVERDGSGERDVTAPRRYGAINAGLQHGFMTVYTNGGHFDGYPLDGDFAYRRYDLMEDWAFGAVHKGVQLAKKAAQAFYGQAPKRSYFDSCSNGGRQGLRSATDFPDDFDGIVSNAPALSWGDVMVKVVWNDAAFKRAPTLTAQKITMAWRYVKETCDATDGVSDGLVGDPRQCDFDPERDLPQCPGEGSGDVGEACFSPAEIQSLKDIHAGPPLADGRTLPQYWDTLEPSAAYGWLANADGSQLANERLADTFFKYSAFYPEQDPNYDWRNFDFDRDPPRMAKIYGLLDSRTDFDAFQKRGGKIIGFWGWADAGLNAQGGIDYYNQVAARSGMEAARDFYRMYFVPGVAHCDGGYGPDEMDLMTPLIEWVEAGKTPERLPVRKTVDGHIKYNRAYCPYPQRTVYSGGDPEQHASWTCEAE